MRAVGPNIGVRGSDATKDYAWLVGQAFGGDFRQTGFGAQGLTVPGGGGVPVASESLGLNYAGSPVSRTWTPRAVVLNQGTNDALNDSLAGFEPAYEQLLRDIHRRWPRAWIFALRPFGGYAQSRIRAAVRAVDRPRTVYVDTTGWVRHLRYTDGLHPTVTGHLAVARHLRTVIARTTGWSARPIGGARSALLAAGAAPGFEGTASAWKPGRDVDAVASARASTPAAYQGRRTLRVTSAVASPRHWRTVVLDRRVALPARARSVFAYVTTPTIASGETFDARLTAVVGGRRFTRTVTQVPSLVGFLPWDRLHVRVPAGSTVRRLEVSVRASSGGPARAVDFQVDAVGWASREGS